VPPSREAESPAPNIDEYLREYLRRNPGSHYTVLLASTQQDCAVSRATVTRHLARLLRFGEIVRRTDHSYELRGPAADRARPLLEVRWRDETTIIHPDQSARVTREQEFRVVSGELRHFNFDLPRPYRNVTWWCTVPSALHGMTSTEVQEPRGTHRVEFTPPIGSRVREWHRFLMAHESLRRRRSSADPDRSRRATAPGLGPEGTPLATESVGPRFTPRHRPGKRVGGSRRSGRSPPDRNARRFATRVRWAPDLLGGRTQ
jgi:hypothetical protein